VKHDDLIQIASEYLTSVMECDLVLTEPALRFGHCGAIEDVIGISQMANAIVIVECKTSRADFKRDLTKLHRIPDTPEFRMALGHYRYFLCPQGVIDRSDLPDGWGLLLTDGSHVLEDVQSERWRQGIEAHVRLVGIMLAEIRRLNREAAEAERKPAYSEWYRKIEDHVSEWGACYASDAVKACGKPERFKTIMAAADALADAARRETLNLAYMNECGRPLLMPKGT
jgi:hypothetical protein